jgi:hypothetical protein
MTRFEPIDLSSLAAAQQPKPTGKQAKQAIETPRNPWAGPIVLFALILFGVWMFRGGDTPGPGPNPIDADGLRVLVVEPDEAAQISKLQNEFVNSIKIAEWVDSKDGQLRRFRESQDISKQDRVWQQMKQQADGTNRVIVVKNRRPYRMPIPEGVEAGIRALEGIK